MRTRRGTSYSIQNTVSGQKRTDRSVAGAQAKNSRKRLKSSKAPAADAFDKLPNDIVISVLQMAGSAATSPADFLAVSLTCKRLNGLGLHSFVLAKASAKTFAVRARKWSGSAYRFLQRSSDAGNIEASYTLGMIQFYCFQQWRIGTYLMTKAALESHAAALYSLAVIQFNGSGVPRTGKELDTAISFCWRAANHGHVDALRELGYRYHDGYGVDQDIVEGRRILLEVHRRECDPVDIHRRRYAIIPGFQFMRAYRYCVHSESHPANRFLVEWFADRLPVMPIRMCYNTGCGRPETRMLEFRRCSQCNLVCYCSRSCQAVDWKHRHQFECRPWFQFNLHGYGMVGW